MEAFVGGPLDYLQIRIKVMPLVHNLHIFTIFKIYIYFTSILQFVLNSYPMHMKVSTDAPNPKSPNVGVKRGLPLKS